MSSIRHKPKMKAIRQEDWGGVDTLKLVEIDRPSALPTDVLIRTKAAGVNPVDIVTRKAAGYMLFYSLPFIPGWDVAGVIEKVGYGVTRFKVGDEVFGMPWFPREAGCYAEYVSSPARHIARKPSSLSFEEAAALPLAGLTALHMLTEIAKVQQGMKVLINGGSGGVGHLAVQIAKAHGAYVIATASQEKHEFLSTLGVDKAIDYTKVSIADTLTELDIVIDLVGGNGIENDEGNMSLHLLRTLKPGGIIVTPHGARIPTLFSEADKLGVRASDYLVDPDYSGLEKLAQLADQGKLKVHVDKTMNLQDAPEAHSHIEKFHTKGKIVLVP